MPVGMSRTERSKRTHRTNAFADLKSASGRVAADGYAIAEPNLRRFLRRKRHVYGDVELPPLSSWLCQTLELVAKLVPSHAGSLLLDDPSLEPGSSPLTFVAAFGPASKSLIGTQVPAGSGIAGHVFRTGATYATAAPQNDPFFFGKTDARSKFCTRSVIAVPVRIERRVCGVLELVNRKGRSSFSGDDVELVEHLARHVSSAITNAVDVLKQNHLATHDELTGLRNARALDAYLLESLRQVTRSPKRDISVLFVDVDRLKQINDRYGHQAGSEAIRRVGHATEAAVGDRGEVFRFGGDELIVVCPGISLEQACEVAAEVVEAVRRSDALSNRVPGGQTPLTVSIGAASRLQSMRQGNDNLAARLLGAADRALYRAKEQGRDRCGRATRRDDRLRSH